MMSVAEPCIESWIQSALQSMQLAHLADNLGDNLAAQINQNPNIAADPNILGQLNLDNPED